MDLKMITSLLHNTVLLFALAFVYGASNLVPYQQSKPKQLFLGLVVGIFAVLIMMNPWHLQEGTFYDTRSVLISITGAFFGGITTIIAVLIASAYRIYVGGGGVYAGVLTIFTSALIGILWRKYRLGKIKVGIAVEFYLFGIIVHLVMMVCQLFIVPWPNGISVVKNIILPVMLIYPIATSIMAITINNHIARLYSNQELIESQLLLKTSIESPKNLNVFVVDKEYKYILFNKHHQDSMKAVYGSEIEKEKSFIDFITVEKDREELKAYFDRAFQGESFSNLNVYGDPKVNQMYIEILYNPVFDARGQIIAVSSFAQNVTDRQRMMDKIEESERRLQSAINQAPIAIMMHAEDGTVIHINNRWSEISGYTLQDIPTIRDWLKKAYKKDPKRYDDIVKNYYNITQRRFDGEYTIHTKYGSEVVWEIYSVVIGNLEDGRKLAMTVAYDITERKQRDNEILFLSYHDHLTGLNNRRFYEQEIIRLANPRYLPLTVVMADINGLKITNDAFGHDAGDELLLRTANIFTKSVSKTGIVARIGGDEFVFLFPNTNKREAHSILDVIKSDLEHLVINGITTTVSFGIKTKIDETDISDIIKQAEIDMYHNKLYETSSARSDTIKAILHTLHIKSPREEYHSKRVSELCQALGEIYKLRKDEINLLKVIGNLHDIGKIAISDATLNKPSKLTPEEWDEVKRHPEIGYRILATSPEYAEIADDILAHHERWDGTGYPKGLKGEEIPWNSRVIAVVDAFDAMTTNRPYRKALTVDEAIVEVINNAGTQFDPDIAKRFVVDYLKHEWTKP